MSEEGFLFVLGDLCCCFMVFFLVCSAVFFGGVFFCWLGGEGGYLGFSSGLFVLFFNSERICIYCNLYLHLHLLKTNLQFALACLNFLCRR